MEAARIQQGINSGAGGGFALRYLAGHALFPAHLFGEGLAGAELFDLRFPAHGPTVTRLFKRANI